MMDITTPPLERAIGIELYLTKTHGIGGKIRQRIDDFCVEEITNRIEGTDGRYLIVELTKRDWDMHHLIRTLSRSLGISQKRFGWAGTKDKRALTKQKISIWDVDAEELQRVNLPGVELRTIGRSNKKVALGDLWGNNFRIIVRDMDIPIEIARERMESITSEIAQARGVPNFFGVQRFGTLRPITHLVGEALVNCDVEKAALIYLAKSSSREPESTRTARDDLLKTRDFKSALKRFPTHLRYERAMLNVLARDPDDYVGAFRVISTELQKMFVHAYQSYVFNRILSRRLKMGLPINSAIPGDVVCFTNKAGLPDVSRIQRTTDDNVDGINNLIHKKRAFVTAPLLGYGSQFADGKPGEVERCIIDEMGIELDNFRVSNMSELASKGRRREILSLVMPITAIDEVMAMQFSLPKGSYATIVLREYMKN
ncbi:MAG: tRNA pseudouridine(13) synthase TruD [Methanosarcinales archaeon Met12]|nr:MAG: tRNA pseudouridine(13) synthase TruD [Methanosarcinales archaeon Met12]